MDDREKKSNVWTHFDLDVVAKKTKCRLCGVSLSYAGSTTSSMRKHLSCKHPQISTVERKPAQQTTLGQFGNFVSKSHKPVNRKWYEGITQKAMLMCVKDMRPISLVKGEGFRAFCEALNPNYQVPCAATIHNYLMKSYEDCKENIISVLKTVPAVALTTDMWTSVATHGYITVTAHYLSDWNLKSCILVTRRVEERHTGANIAANLKSIQEEFGINTVSGITTDNASNMSVAAKTAGYPHVRCFAHTLQLAVHDGLKVPGIENMLMHARKLVAFFSKSTMATQFLESHQKKLGKTPKHVITDVVTRWNSVYFLLDRLSLLHGDIVAVLFDPLLKKHKHIDLKDNHWTLVDRLVIALKPLVSATEVLCSEEFPTASGVYPLVTALVDNHLVVRDLDTNIIGDMKARISAGLSSRLFQDGFLQSPTLIASALDPCYKNLKCLKPEQRTEVQDAVIDLITQAADDQPRTDVDLPAAVSVKEEPGSPFEPAQPTVKKFNFCESGDAMSFLLSDIIEISDDIEDKRDIRTEYTEFLNAQTRVRERSTLKSLSLSWWREDENLFPRIAPLAKRYLCIPGTSVPSERAFSAAGLTITKQRAALSPETADAIIFLNKNLRDALKEEEPPSGSSLNPVIKKETPDDTRTEIPLAAATETPQQAPLPALPTFPDITN